VQRHRQTRQDDEEFLALAARLAIRSDIVSYPMSDAPRAPSELAHARCSGAPVLYAARRLRTANVHSVTGAALGPSSRARAVICFGGAAYPERGVEGPWSMPMNRDRLT